MSKWFALVGVCGAAWAGAAGAQVSLDRADPTVVQQSLPQAVAHPDRTDVSVTVEQVRPAAPRTTITTPVIQAVSVEGRGAIPAARFADAIGTVVGRALTQADLVDLAGAIAAIAKKEGYPLATAVVEPQKVEHGILRVSLAIGKIDAVRVIGAKNALADRILAQVLITGRGARGTDLERAILLVGDIAGVRVKESRFVQQDGFGILLVTIEEDRATGYLQVDNRGSDEVGPIRSTALATFRGLVRSGDELVLIASNTLQLTEFMFVGGRYVLPVGTSGTVLSGSASYGRSNPGASLSALDVVGKSVDFGVAFSKPIFRSRARSVWVNVELRGLSITQKVSGTALRDDRQATFTAKLTGISKFMNGTLHGEISTVVGLPFGGVTQAGDLLASRFDGDARFVTVGYLVDWTRPLGNGLEIVLASAGQLASRPLLANAEIGAGGASFGRAYDYAERTGDQGILGSAELRADIGRIVPGLIDRTQLYSFVDGGMVSNLRDGLGGGSLLSMGGGARLVAGLVDGTVEIALPLNADRFDTGNRDPRVSVRIARQF